MEEKKFRIVYEKFLAYLGMFIGFTKVNQLLSGSPLFNERGVHFNFKKPFEDFLKENIECVRIMQGLKWKFYPPENIAGEYLRTPVVPFDDKDMVDAGIRKPVYEEVDWSIYNNDASIRDLSSIPGNVINHKFGGSGHFPKDNTRMGIYKIYIHNPRRDPSTQKGSNFFKTTYSFECKIRECNGIRNNFMQENKGLVIKKSKWCAK